MKSRLSYTALKFSLTLGLALVFSGALHAQHSLELVYKKIDSTELKMNVDYPPGYQPGQRDVYKRQILANYTFGLNINF